MCTCATDAEAIGTGEISANSSSGGLPNSSTNVRCTSSYANGPTLSCSVSSARITCGGNRSGRVDMICPTLTNVAPSPRNSPTTQRAEPLLPPRSPCSSTTSTAQPTQNCATANSTSAKIAERAEYEADVAHFRRASQVTIRLKGRPRSRKNCNPWRQRWRRRQQSSAPKPAERPLSVQNGVVMFNDRVKAAASHQVLRWKEGGVWRTATWADWDRASREIAGGPARARRRQGRALVHPRQHPPRVALLRHRHPHGRRRHRPHLPVEPGVRVRVHHQRLGRQDRLRREPGAAAKAHGRARQALAAWSRSSTSMPSPSWRSPTPRAAPSSSSTTSSSPPTRRG